MQLGHAKRKGQENSFVSFLRPHPYSKDIYHFPSTTNLPGRFQWRWRTVSRSSRTHHRFKFIIIWSKAETLVISHQFTMKCLVALTRAVVRQEVWGCAIAVLWQILNAQSDNNIYFPCLNHSFHISIHLWTGGKWHWGSFGHYGLNWFHSTFPDVWALFSLYHFPSVGLTNLVPTIWENIWINVWCF